MMPSSPVCTGHKPWLPIPRFKKQGWLHGRAVGISALAKNTAGSRQGATVGVILPLISLDSRTLDQRGPFSSLMFNVVCPARF